MQKNAPFCLYLNCSLLVQHSPARGRPLTFTAAPQKPLRRDKEIHENLSTVRVRYINEAGGVSLLRGGFNREIKEINDTPPLPVLHTVFVHLFIILTSQGPFHLSEHPLKTTLAQIPLRERGRNSHC